MTYFRSLVRFFGISRFLPDEPDSLFLWDGEDALVFESVTWQGTGSPKGVLMEVSSIHSQQDVAENRVTIAIAIAPEAHAEFWANDFSGIDVDTGYIVSTDDGRSWVRLPQRFRGRVSETIIRDAVARITVETYLGDIDRGVVRYWDHATQQFRYPGDTFFRFTTSLPEGIDLEGWPL